MTNKLKEENLKLRSLLAKEMRLNEFLRRQLDKTHPLTLLFRKIKKVLSP